MKTFKEGDRVNHPRYGAGTVTDPYPGTGWPTVQFDNGDKLMTDDSLLSPVPQAPKFKIGDRVSHPIHRDGTVEDIQTNGLYVVNVGGGRVYMALGHQIKPAKPEPKFELTVIDNSGVGYSVGPNSRKQIELHLTEGVQWDTVESITITRQKG